MLTLHFPEDEVFDDGSSSFRTLPEASVDLEHSLFSLSKWESSFEKPFLSDSEKTIGETAAYINCMAISPIDESILVRLRPEHFQKVNEYIASKQTATWFAADNKPGRKGRPQSNTVITSEIIYYWMVSAQIPWEAQHWHLNRLLTLIRVVDEKSQKPKKMSRKETMDQHRALNAARRKRRLAKE